VKSQLANTWVRLLDHYLEIERLGGFSQIHKKGLKRIPLHSITAVQFSPNRFFSPGFIQFTVLGGNEDTSTSRLEIGASANENSVGFGTYEHRAFSRLRDLVKDAISKPRADTRKGQLSMADELMKLAQLRNAGVLSEAEFDAQKARLLE
jgi:hypothetical protein